MPQSNAYHWCKQGREYRQEYHVERGFGRLKGAPLSIAPLFVQRDDQVAGLTHLLKPRHDPGNKYVQYLWRENPCLDKKSCVR
jgi:hypothetical protein